MRDLSALVQQWHAEGRTVIAVLHDLDHVRREYPQTLLLAREAVAYGDTTSVLSEPNLQRARQLADDRTPETEGTPVCQDDISPS
jgi:zinc/manganese transport system ATP-binding protein